MKNLKFLVLVPLIILAVGCADIQKPDIYKTIDVSYDPVADKVNLVVNMGEHFNFPMSASYPILNYGEIGILEAIGEDPAKIFLSVNTDTFNVNADLVGTLPTGVAFPSYVEGQLAELQINDNFFIYVNPGAPRYLGLAILIDQVGSVFPTGLLVSYVFKNAEGEQAGVGSFFGPKLNSAGAVVVPGGLFVVADIKSVFDIGSFTATGEAQIQAAAYNMTRKHYKILKKAGYIRE